MCRVNCVLRWVISLCNFGTKHGADLAQDTRSLNILSMIKWRYVYVWWSIWPNGWPITSNKLPNYHCSYMTVTSNKTPQATHTQKLLPPSYRKQLGYKEPEKREMTVRTHAVILGWDVWNWKWPDWRGTCSLGPMWLLSPDQSVLAAQPPAL